MKYTCLFLAFVLFQGALSFNSGASSEHKIKSVNDIFKRLSECNQLFSILNDTQTLGTELVSDMKFCRSSTQSFISGVVNCGVSNETVSCVSNQIETAVDNTVTSIFNYSKLIQDSCTIVENLITAFQECVFGD